MDKTIIGIAFLWLIIIGGLAVTLYGAIKSIISESDGDNVSDHPTSEG